jgi:hypothetical protein
MKNALELGRERFRRGGPYSPSDSSVALEAARHPDFAPEVNNVDADIQRWLRGWHGVPVSEIGRDPDADFYTTAERQEIQSAEAAAAALRAKYDLVIARRFEAEALYFSPPARTPIEDLVLLARKHEHAIEAQRVATSDLEKAIARVTSLKMQVQNRRRHQALARIGAGT